MSAVDPPSSLCAHEEPKRRRPVLGVVLLFVALLFFAAFCLFAYVSLLPDFRSEPARIAFLDLPVIRIESIYMRIFVWLAAEVVLLFATVSFLLSAECLLGPRECISRMIRRRTPRVVYIMFFFVFVTALGFFLIVWPQIG